MSFEGCNADKDTDFGSCPHCGELLNVRRSTCAAAMLVGGMTNIRQHSPRHQHWFCDTCGKSFTVERM